MLTLAEFLLARIAEDEEVARDAMDSDRPGAHWVWSAPDDSGDPDTPRWLRTVEEFPTTSGVGPLPAFPLGFEFRAEPTPAMAHIARHDPARVLAECEAKRRIVENHPRDDAGYCGDGIGLVGCKWLWPCPTLRALALPYADHPDYREEWNL